MQNNTTEQQVTVLSKTFSSDEERRAYFREELRKKLPVLKQMEGFPIGEDDDIVNLSDPPYYTACPNPWLNDIIEKWEDEKKELEKSGERVSSFNVLQPYASDVSEGKNNPIYMAHSYHTKVPHPAIIKYLNHYTQPHDIVFDGFAGTGMTGVASSLISNKGVQGDSKKSEYRNAILNDLSPIASFIAYNYNGQFGFERINSITDQICDIEKSLEWIYRTKHTESHYGIIDNVIWSEVYQCKSCPSEFTYWEAAVSLEENLVKKDFHCPKCRAAYQKQTISPVTETVYIPERKDSRTLLKLVPVLIKYSYQGKRYDKEPDDEDIKTIQKVNDISLDHIALDQILGGDEIGRLAKHGIEYAREIYFRRSRYVIETILKDAGLDALFLLTAVSQNSSKLYRFRLNGKGGTTSGTYYICSTPQENNVFKSIKKKLSDIKKALRLINRNQLVMTGSATNIDLRDECIDYIFTDPPFGSNLMYSELNLMMETWLKVFTNNSTEAITNRFQEKSASSYQSLMTRCFKEKYRLLKKGKWMTVEFSNTNASIWNTIQTSIQNSGFIVANVSALDKKQGSFKAVNTVTAVKQDLVISCYKPSSEFDKKFQEKQYLDTGVWEFIDEHLHHLPIHLVKNNATTSIIERSPKILFDRLIAFYVQKGLKVPIDAGKFQRGLKERFTERDGMFFSTEQVQEYDRKKSEVPEFIQMSFFVGNEQDSIYWLRNLLEKEPRTDQDLHPLWMTEVASNMKKGDSLPEMRTILEENFLRDSSGKWYVPDPENEADLEKIRTKRLLNTFGEYQQIASTPRGKIKEVRLEALRAGFKKCYQDQDFKTIISVGDRIPNNLLMEDEVLLQFYDIASAKV